MRKVAEVTTPRRGRPKKNLITPKSAPAATGEASHVPQNGTKSSDVQVSSKKTRTSSIERQSLITNKRNGSRSASVDSSGIISKKRRHGSPEKTTGSGSKTSTPNSRASSKEKVETLLSKTVKQEAIKVAQSLESLPTRFSNRGKVLGRLETTRKKIIQSKKLNIKTSHKRNPIKELKTDFKDNHKSEIKRLLTTDGFWSSKTSSRSNSPLGQPLEPSSQKLPLSVIKGSGTSTPDISPLCTKRQSITKIQADKEDAATPKSNIPVSSELRRLRTTDAFSFRESAAVSSIAGSRDVSPSSGSSLDRMMRQNTRPLSRNSENKNNAKTQEALANDVVQGKSKIKKKKALDDVNDKLSEQCIETLETLSMNSSTLGGEQANFESPASRFRKKEKSASEQPAKQDKFSSLVRRGKSSPFVRGVNKQQQLKMASALSHPVTEEPSIDPIISTSISTPEVKDKKNSSKKSRVGLKQIKHTLKDTGSLRSPKSSEDLVEVDMNMQEVCGEITMADSGFSGRDGPLPVSEQPAKQDKFSSHVRRGKSSPFVRKINKQQQLKMASALWHPVNEKPSIDPIISTSISTPEVKEKKNSSKKSRVGLKRIKHTIKDTGSLEQPKSSEDLVEVDMNMQEVCGEITMADSGFSGRDSPLPVSEQPAKQDKFSSLVRRGKSSPFVRKINKQQQLKMASALSHPVTEKPSIDPIISTSISTPEVKEKKNSSKKSRVGLKRIKHKLKDTGSLEQPKSSEDFVEVDIITKEPSIDPIISTPISTPEVKEKKNSSKKGRVGLKQIKHKLKDNSLSSPKSSEDIVEVDMNMPEVCGEITSADSGFSGKACSSHEFAISDLLDSAELKRLNTTAGFWASTPDIGTVLGNSYPRRLRDTDINSIRASSDHLTPKQPRQLKELPKFQKTSVKSQSTLLQHRKKRLHALQNSLRKIKQQISNEELAEQHKLLDNAPLPTTEAVAKQEPSPKRHISMKKPGYKTRSKLNNTSQDKILKEMHAPTEQDESTKTEVDIKESSGSVDLKVGTTETLEANRSELNKEPQESSGSKTNTSVTDSLPSKKIFVKSWKRGRRKLLPGDATTHSANLSSIKTRGRGKVDSSAKSLEVLQRLEPNREDKLLSPTQDTLKVGRGRTKLKRAKKESVSELSLSVNEPDIDIDKLSLHSTEAPQLLDQESKDNNEDHESCSKITTMETETDNGNVEKHSVLSRQNSLHKKDNLFESMGYDLLMPSDVPCVNMSYNDASVASLLNENIVQSQVIKSDLPELADNCDHTKKDVGELDIRESSTIESDSNKTCTNAEESDKLDATDMKVVTVYKESIKDIPLQPDSITHTPSHDLAIPGSPAGPTKLQSLDDSLVMENTEPNSATSDAQNDITVAGETVHECDTSAAQVKEIIPVEATVISVREQSPLEGLDTVGTPSHLADKKANIEQCIEDNLECSISCNANSQEVTDTSNEKEQIESGPYVNVENKSLQCTEETELDLGAGDTSQHVDIMTVPICDSTNDFNQHETLPNSPADHNHSVKSEGEKQVEFVGETEDLRRGEQDEMLNNGSKIISDPTSNMSGIADQHFSEGKAVENIVVDISAAPSLAFPHGDDVSTLHSVQHLAEAVGLKRRKKKKKHIQRLIQHNLPENTQIESHSVLNIQAPPCNFDKSEVTSEVYLCEKLVASTIPTKAQLKKLRKRRRNAWQRGVLKKSSNLSRKNSKQGWLLNSEKSNTQSGVVTSVIKGASTDSVVTSLIEGARTDSVVTSLIEGASTDSVATSLIEGARTDSVVTSLIEGASTDSVVTSLIEGASTDSVVTSLIEGARTDSVVTSLIEGASTDSVATSLIEGASTASVGLQDENIGNQADEFYSPAVKKSLSYMLKKLETNANLANAVLVKQPYKGRFLRNVQPQEKRGKRLKMREKKLDADSSAQHDTDGVKSLSDDSITELQIDIPKDLDVSGTVKRKRGRPKKRRDESFPKLTPLHNLPTLRPVAPWNKAPPNLSPQTIISQPSTFFDSEELKNTPDVEFVCESVDDTDLHLYLSGVSDDEQSPKKESVLVSYTAEIQADIPVWQEKKYDDNSKQETIEESALIFEDTSASQESVLVNGKEAKKMVRPKFKGRRGCPPGIPMTEEERRKKVHKTLLSRETYVENDLESLGASPKLSLLPDVCDSPVFIGKILTPAAKFSLRKKSTRSPLEMLAMKRKQEEARYDLEQEKRQARLIHLREMRSARESGDGFSDDGDGSILPENLSLCSVVLSDFVKKLQLDHIVASSYEEVDTQDADNLSTYGESPEYNEDEEDWCADLEEHGTEDRNDNRPYIPRLKLKRIIKTGASSQSKRTNVNKQQEPNEKHVPIKLVIKTEPPPEQSEHHGVKSISLADPAKVDKSSFENSFMDFLRGNNEQQKAFTPRRRYNLSRHTNTEMNNQNITDLSSAEILTLPISVARDSSVRVDQNSLSEVGRAASVDKHQLASSLIGAVASTPHLSHVGTSNKSAAKLSSVENVEATKRLSSGDEEDDDILILDLDDSAVDPNPEDTFRDNLQLMGGPPSSAEPLNPGMDNTTKVNEIVSKENDITSQEYPATEDNSAESEVPRSTFRSYSNDEMGLMFESYNSQKDQGVDNHSDAEQNTAAISASSEKLGNCSENQAVTQISQISHSVASILMESDKVQKSNISGILQPESILDNVEEPLPSSETDAKNASKTSEDEATSADTATTTKEALNVDNLDGQTEAHIIEQCDGGKKETEQGFMSKISVNPEDGTAEETNNLPHSESLAAASERTVGDDPSDIATLDNNNITQAVNKSMPKVSVPVKKAGLVSDNSKSPKHSTYYGSGPEEWKVKVILHSDKFPSGKYSCKRCGFTTPSKLIIESHIYSHIPGVQFRCAYCESEFSSMAATSSHLKNTHSLSEAKLHISRHIDEKNFYDKEAAVFSEENGQHSAVQATCASTNSGGQSPPVIISVVVSGSNRGGRPSAPPRRFVCTHCGFSTNVKEDAEHHVLDLHSSQSLFACLLCSENVCYTECEIKDHCATVHPARHHPYRKLPDFYDADQLNLKEKAVSQDDRENIFERMTSMFQDDSPTGTSSIDHRQKAKEYLYLQEGWREKTRVEADSTTAVDYTEEPSAPQTPTQECSIDEASHQTDVTENEVSDHHSPASQAADVVTGIADLSESAALSDDAFITSSAGSALKILSVVSQVVDSGVPSEPPDQQAGEDEEETLSRQLEEPACHSALEAPVDDHDQESYHHPHSIEDNDDDSQGIGLKIIQVVSLSGQEEDIVDEQMTTDQAQPEEVDTGAPAESDGQVVARPSTSTTTISDDDDDAPELSAPRDSLVSNEDTVMQKDIQAQSTVENLKDSSQADVATESPATDASAGSSAVASPSFAGGLPLSYKCNACRVHTPYLLMMVKHLKARHPNMRCFSCPYCKTTHSFVSQKQLRHHVKQSHPNKFGRNEIALSEDAKKFVEAMVLPMGPECIRVGSRIVLEEDIHTCTYCQVKMISLANVYEHLNTKHSDLFEFVCPVCQSFKHKMLTEISEHCQKAHKSSLDTDKVHVSVPKNLFTALTCISKNGKYIEKNLVSGPVACNIDKASASSSSVQGKVSGVSPMENLTPAAVHSPLRLTSSASTPTHAGVALVSSAQTNQPIFAIPLMSTGIGIVPSAKTVVAFSSALFDTSSLAATPHMAAAPQSSPVVHNAAAASFLSPLPQPAHLNNPNTQSSKQHSPLQMHPRPRERAQGPAKNLPVLNVPTIKPRASSLAAKSAVAGRRADDHSHADKVPKSTFSTSSSIASILTTSSANQLGMRPHGSLSSLDNLPDDEPNPDAFKIFNLRPSSSHTSSSASPTVSPGVQTAFAPVSSPITSGYLQGQIAGFPPGMVIPPNLLPLSFSFAQHQPLMQGMLVQKHNQRNSPLSRHPRMSHPSSASMTSQSPPTVRSNITQQETTTATAVFLKKQQQQRELYLLKKQHQLLRHNQQQAVPRVHPAHQQPPSLSGQVYQPQPLPMSPLSFDQRPVPSEFSQSSLFMSPLVVTSTAPSPSTQPTIAHTSSPSRPSKGIHKRSSSLYQCPYCPVLVTLRALEVASHIQQNHRGKQVAFKKIA